MAFTTMVYILVFPLLPLELPLMSSNEEADLPKKLEQVVKFDFTPSYHQGVRTHFTTSFEGVNDSF